MGFDILLSYWAWKDTYLYQMTCNSPYKLDSYSKIESESSCFLSADNIVNKFFGNIPVIIMESFAQIWALWQTYFGNKGLHFDTLTWTNVCDCCAAKSSVPGSDSMFCKYRLQSLGLFMYISCQLLIFMSMY